MGMYTELVLGLELDNDEATIQKLKYMLDNTTDDVMIDDPFFKTPRWTYMLCCDSYYFDGQTDSKLVYDIIAGTHFLNVRCNLKNYDNEIELFLKWLAPHIKTDGFLGYMRYEEDENPTLIYNTADGIILYEIPEVEDDSL